MAATLGGLLHGSGPDAWLPVGAAPMPGRSAIVPNVPTSPRLTSSRGADSAAVDEDGGGGGRDGSGVDGSSGPMIHSPPAASRSWRGTQEIPGLRGAADGGPEPPRTSAAAHRLPLEGAHGSGLRGSGATHHHHQHHVHARPADAFPFLAATDPWAGSSSAEPVSEPWSRYAHTAVCATWLEAHDMGAALGRVQTLLLCTATGKYAAVGCLMPLLFKHGRQ